MSDTGNWKTLQDSKKERFDLHLRHGQQGAVRHPRGFPALQEKVSFFHINNSPFTIQNNICCRFVEIYGEITPKLAEEDKKIFEMWMENWIEQRQNDFSASFSTASAYKSWGT